MKFGVDACLFEAYTAFRSLHGGAFFIGNKGFFRRYMASMNSDIRLRSRATGRLALILISAALAALVLSAGISLLPFNASAATQHDFSGDDNGNHNGNDHDGDNGNHNGGDNHHAVENTYELCHNQADDNHNGLTDLKDPDCASVNNDIPDLFNQSIVTAENVASLTALSGTDADNDLLYFAVT